MSRYKELKKGTKDNLAELKPDWEPRKPEQRNQVWFDSREQTQQRPSGTAKPCQGCGELHLDLNAQGN